jgi:hypothetical protein
VQVSVKNFPGAPASYRSPVHVLERSLSIIIPVAGTCSFLTIFATGASRRVDGYASNRLVTLTISVGATAAFSRIA